MLIKKIDIKDERPYRECSKFETCSCNKCPLDPDIAIRVSHPDDEKYTARKSERNRIGSKYPHILPMQGYFRAEWAGKQKWAALSPIQKEEVRKRGANNLNSNKTASESKENLT